MSGDTDLTSGFDVPKLDPGAVVKTALDGLSAKERTLLKLHFRDGLGVEYEDRWAALAAANVACARRQGAAGNAEVIRGDARLLRGLLPPGTAGRAALVVTSPPYGPSVHGQVVAEPGRGRWLPRDPAAAL